MEHSIENLAEFERRPLTYKSAPESPQVAAACERSTFAAVYCVYDDDIWLTRSLESVYDACDAIWVLVSSAAWNGEPTDNARIIESIGQFHDPKRKIRVVRGDWSSETEHRTAGLAIVREAGYGYCFVVDADEVYGPDDLRRMMELASSCPQVDYWHVKTDTYWKSCRYRIEPREPSEPVVFVKAATGSFSGCRKPESEGTHATIQPEIGICHRLSYARPDDFILKKIAAFSHADEIRPDWFRQVWQKWDADRSLRNLHPVNPSEYYRAVPQSYAAMPPVLQQLIETDGRQADAAYDRALQLVCEGALEEAASELERLVEAFPGHAQANNDLGVLRFQDGDTRRATLHLEWAFILDPDDAGAAKNLADVYLAAGRTQDAARLYHSILSSKPNDVEALIGAGHVCRQAGEFEEAAALFARALELDPENESAMESAQALNEEVRLSSTETAAEYQPTRLRELAREPLVSIVIPVYNKLDLTKACLESLYENTDYPNCEIIVVDNGSTDGTTEYLKGLGGERLKPIFSSENLGFVDACRSGADAASGEYLMFLNNDTEVQPHWLRPLIEIAETTPDCGAVGSKLIYPNGKLQEAGAIIFSDGNGWNYGRGFSPSEPRFNFVREVDYCSGAALLVRKDLWDEIGGFDRRYAPAYYEDSDLCFEIRKRGFKVYYQPRSAIIHHEGQTAGTDLHSGWKQYQALNRAKFVKKWSDELARQYAYTHSNIPKASSRSVRGSVLVADPFLPWFDRASGSMRLFQIITLLRQMGLHVTFIARNPSMESRYRPILEDMGIEVYAGDYAAMRAAGISLRGSRPLSHEGLFGERSFDYAILSTWRLAGYYLPLLRTLSPRTRVIVDTVDVHFLRELREAELKDDAELREEALTNKQSELAVYRKADRLWVVTPQDREALESEVGSIPIDVIPNIHGHNEAGKSFAETSDLLFVGNFNHPPNADAVHYFCGEVLPLIQCELPDVKLYIVGNSPPADVQALASDQIIVTGYVEDLSPYLLKARVSVSPLRYGAGMKGKVGEALSRGLPVVTTSIGAEGMGLVDGIDVLIADNPGEFAAKTVRLYQDRELWEQLSRNGRGKVEEWSPESVRERLESVLVTESPPTEKLVSIVILARNQLSFTKSCLESIGHHTRTPYELVIVDNGSTDGTDTYLARFQQRWEDRPAGVDKFCKAVKVIRHGDNLGYAAGNNSGIAVAEGDYVLLLNNDVVVTPGWLETMLRYAEQFPRTGLVGPMSNFVSGHQLVRDIGYNTSSLSGLNGFAERWSKEHAGHMDIFWRVVGFCVLISRSVIEEIGGLDARFGLGNFEDDDFCLRAAIAGFRCVIASDCFVHHFGSRTFAGERIDRDRLILDNWELFKEKWGLPPELAYGQPYDLTSVFEQPFDPARHFCAVAPDTQPGEQELRAA